MKKFLLFASFAALALTASAAIGTDDQTYDAVDGFSCTNIWCMSQTHNTSSMLSFMQKDRCRSAAVHDGKLYIGDSTNDDATIVDENGDLVNCCGIEVFDALTGEFLNKIKVTLEGTRISGLLCANSLGWDNFGHLWIAPLVMSKANGYKVYSVDPATGAATLQLSGSMTNVGRIDYCDVVGDITRVEANCTVMAVADPPATDATVYRWSAAKGGTFKGGWNEDGDDSFVMPDLYPADQVQWSNASVVKMVLGEGEDDTYNGDLFYVDAMSTYPTLYNSAGTIIESFASAPDLVPSKVYGNGVCEFKIAGTDFIAYCDGDHNATPGNSIIFCKLGEGMSFNGMTKYWQIPADGMGKLSDGGIRYLSIGKQYVKDGNGKEGCYMTLFKCMNGAATYLIAENGFNAGVKGVTADNGIKITVNGNLVNVNATASSIFVYNAAGQKIAEANNASQIQVPASGLFIVKAMVNGNSAVKKVLI
jgi:hypothetical protein